MPSTADTNGWDTVFAIKFPDVNAAIAAAKASPKTFELRDGKNPDDVLEIKGTFAEWSLTTGGQGQNLHMLLALPSGELSRTVTDPTTRAATTTKLDLTNASAVIEVSLELIPQADAAADSGKQNLKLKTRAALAGAPAVSVLRFDLPPGNPGNLLQRETAKSMLQSWLTEHLRAFNHVFATVDLNLRADVAGLQWLMPTRTAYAVSTERSKLEDCVFAVLSMTEQREKQAGALPHAVSPNAIPPGKRSGFLISSERFLEKVLLPAMPLLFKDAKDADFSIGDDGKQITNNKKLAFQPLEIEPGKTVNPTISPYKFSISIQDDRLRLLFDTLDFEYSPGMNAAVKFDSFGKVRLGEGQRIELAMSEASTAGSTVEASLGVQVAGIVSGLALLIIGSIIGVCMPGEASVIGEASAELGENGTTFALDGVTATVTDGATTIGAPKAGANPIWSAATDLAAVSDTSLTANFTGWLGRNWGRIGLITASVLTGGGIMAVFPIIEAVQKGHLDQIPTLEKLTSHAVKPVSWPTASKYTLTSVALNGSLQLGGDPGFTV